jgi:hypothetical protein
VKLRKSSIWDQNPIKNEDVIEWKIEPQEKKFSSPRFKLGIISHEDYYSCKAWFDFRTLSNLSNLREQGFLQDEMISAQFRETLWIRVILKIQRMIKLIK